MPRMISKYGRPLPYFMKYASPYYERLKLSRSQSNMNKLCWAIERWRKGVRFKRTEQEFDDSIMIDNNVPVPDVIYNKMEQFYHSFCAEVRELISQLNHSATELEEAERKRRFALLYERYRNRCYALCNNDATLVANTAVMLCHNHKNWNQRFKWIVGGAGIVKNIKQVDISLPKRDDTGNFEYLGKRYTMVKVQKEDVLLIDR